MLSRAHSKPIVEVVPYDGELDTNVMSYWISNMEKFFEFESTLDNGKVNMKLLG